MNDTKNVSKAMSLQVANGLTVQVLPNNEHEFLIPTTDVAKGYGVSETTFRRHKQEHTVDLIEGKHFVTLVQNLNAGCKSERYNLPPVKRTYWTKRGVIRMGFFIRSERARLFRDWAEDLIVSKLTQPQQPNLKAFCIPVRQALTEARLSFNPQRVAAMRGAHPTEWAWLGGQWYCTAEYKNYLVARVQTEAYRLAFRYRKEERQGTQLSMWKGGNHASH